MYQPIFSPSQSSPFPAFAPVSRRVDTGYSFTPKSISMAKNGKAGDGRRHGAVRKRSQVLNPKTGKYVKRDRTTGRFMDVKADGTPFKGVTKEK